MAVENGADFHAYLISGATCTYASGVNTITNGTCTEVGYIDNYTLTMTAASLPTTAFGDYNTKNINGIPTGKMTAAGSYDATDAQQDAIRAAVTANSLLIWRLKKAGGKEAKTFAARVDNYAENGAPTSRVSFNFALSLQSIPKDCTHA